MKPFPVHILRRVLIALVLLSVSPLLLHAQPDATPSNAAPAVPATPAATTNAAPAVPTLPATNVTSAPDTNAAAASTNAAAAATNAATGTETEQEGPGTPGSMAAPGSELVGPPAPGSANAPMGAVPPGGLPTDNPAVTDVTNNPGAVAGLGHRKFPFYFGLNLGEMYDDNILISPDGQKQSAFITHFTPFLDYQLGNQDSPHMNYFNAYFAPSIYIYDNKSKYNRTDYNGDLYYQYNWTRLSVGLEQNYQHLTDATLDEGQLVSRNIYTTKANANYAYNDDLSLYSTATQQVSSYPGITIKEWDLDMAAMYRIAPKLQIGAGPRLAFIDVTKAPNEQHQDLLFRLRYDPDEHFIVTFEGGVEYLQYQDATPSRLLPVYDFNFYYLPWRDTTLFISSSRQTWNSFDFQGDTVDYTTIQAGASQNFLEKFTASVTGGYHEADYQSSGSGNDSVQSTTSTNQLRSDNYYFAKGSLKWEPNNWLEVEADYQYSTNDSTFSGFSFTDNQVDIQSTVKF